MAASAQPVLAVSREGNLLRVNQGAVLPNFCVKCGKPATHRLKKNFYWHNPLLFILALAGLLLYAVVAVIVRKRLTMEVPLCDTHWEARRTKIKIAIGLLLGFLPFGIVVSVLSPDNAGWAWLIAVVMFFTGVVYAAMAANVIAPTYIDKSYGKFKNVSPEFLAILGSQ
jgi:hypothetical protein